MNNTNVLVFTNDQYRVLYEILTDIYPQVKDPEPAFLELFDYVTKEYELQHGEYQLAPAAKAFTKIYQEKGCEWMAKNSKEWTEFKESYNRMSKLGLLSSEG
jgi:hypothetical protein